MSPIIMAPFGTERGKEWPLERFRELALLLFDRLGLQSVIVGAPHQRSRANEIVRGLSNLAVKNACGAMTWNEVRGMLVRARCAVVNNSGIAHLAAALGTRTVCIFGGAHDVTEWHPRGPRVVIVRRKVVCSPCMILASTCPNGLACLTEITAEQVFSIIRDFVPAPGDRARDADGPGARSST
jgi:ADP-heptose:LPS heptosyltransferase